MKTIPETPFSRFVQEVRGSDLTQYRGVLNNVPKPSLGTKSVDYFPFPATVFSGGSGEYGVGKCFLQVLRQVDIRLVFVRRIGRAALVISRYWGVHPIVYAVFQTIQNSLLYAIDRNSLSQVNTGTEIR